MTNGRNKSWRTRLTFDALANIVAVIPATYGVYCVLARSGLCVGPQGPERKIEGGFKLIRVEGESALLAGCGYLALGVFVYLSSQITSSTGHTWRKRLPRALIRWGSLGATLWFWNKAITSSS